MYTNVHTRFKTIIFPTVQDSEKLPEFQIFTHLNLWAQFVTFGNDSVHGKIKREKKKKKICKNEPVKTYFIIPKSPGNTYTQYLLEYKANISNLNPTLTAVTQFIEIHQD